METLYEDAYKKVYMNSSKEIFVQNKLCGTTLRMQTEQVKHGISIACNHTNISVCNYHSVYGLHFLAEK